MVQQKSPKNEKVESPATTYDKPHDILKDKELSHHEKKEALKTWEQDARQLMTASNEGMPGAEEGIKSKDHHRLGEVIAPRTRSAKTPNKCHPTSLAIAGDR
jgi:hypothetical protein